MSLHKIREKANNNISHFKLINGILYRANFNEAKDYNGKIVVPTKLRNNTILKLAHETRIGGHLGRKEN